MANGEIIRFLEFANIQMAAEAFLSRSIDDVPNRPPSNQLLARLQDGNTHATKFLLPQASQFISDYEVLAQYRNDPLLTTGSGFSGTLFRTKVTDPARGLVAGELTLSFRSSEFIDDAVRDGKSVQELEPAGKAAEEVAALWEWIAGQIGILKSGNQVIRMRTST